MYKFGKKSLTQLETCHTDIQTILNEVIKFYDFSILEGIRTAERQQLLFVDGKSTLDGVNKLSKHQGKKDDNDNVVSFAVDIMPYYKGFNPFTDKNGNKSFYYMAGLVMAITETLYNENKISHLLTWGGNWDNDLDFFSDSSFFDLPHFQLRRP
jgi:peptidoglycan L-alanyl-D-glutamate endopeptidase CwlK